MQQPSEASDARRMGLGGLERELHASFQASRLPLSGSTHEHDLVAFLEAECEDHAPAGEAFRMTPVVVTGPPGCGKSTLLAEWLEKRHREQLTKKRAAGLEHTHGEFVFVHVVGCTRQSILVRELLCRLVSELVMHFDLPMVHDFDPEKLAWDLPRLLEAAGAKGDVLLVIDGLNRLRNDSGEVNLSWLPQAFPPHVRVVLSTTLPPHFRVDGEHHPEKKKKVKDPHLQEELRLQKRVLGELQRRRWTLSQMHFSVKVKRSIMRTFLDMALPDEGPPEPPSEEPSVFITAQPTTVSAPSSLTSGAARPPPRPRAPMTRAQKKLDLFGAQHEHLEDVPTTSLTLATFLRALVWSAGRGFDVWQLQESWLRRDHKALHRKRKPAADDEPVTTAEMLFDAILDTWETGHAPDAEQKAMAQRRSSAAGLLVGKELRAKFAAIQPPSESEAESEESDDMPEVDPNSLAATLDRPMTGRLSEVGSSRPATAATAAPPSTAASARRLTKSGASRRLKPAATAASAQAVADARWTHTQHGASRALSRTKELASLVTDRLLAAAEDEDQNEASGSRRGFLDMFLRGEEEPLEEEFECTVGTATDQSPPPEDDYRSVQTPPAGALEEFEDVPPEGPAPGPTPAPAPRPAAFPEALGQPAVEEVADEPAAEVVEDEPVEEEDDDGYGDDDFEDDGYGDDDFDDEDEEEEAKDEEPGEAKEEPAAEEDTLEPKESPANSPREKAESSGSATTAESTREEPAEEALKSEEASADESDLPDYLMGGSDKVEGLGPVLGDALALLCVARYGLTEAELWAMLHDLANERAEDEKKVAAAEEEERLANRTDDERAEDEKAARLLGEQRAEEKDDDLDDLAAFLSSDDACQGTNDQAFPPALVDELPKMLAALGVLWDPQERVLVLPQESEALREVVYRRYVAQGATRVKLSIRRAQERHAREVNSLYGSRGSAPPPDGGGGDWWHARVAAYFDARPASRRRAEELPWHLEQCRQWTPLCEALSDVRTFETMFLGPPQMKLELANYWKLLTDGPLYLTEAAENSVRVATQDLTPNQVILSHLDTAHALGLIEAKAKRDRLADQSATFDVVDAYQRAVENWTHQEKPTTHRLFEVLSHIGDFLVGFSEKVDPPPPFLRGSLDWKRLETVGVKRPKVEKLLDQAATASGGAAATSGRRRLEDSVAADPEPDEAENASISAFLANVKGDDTGNPSEKSSLYHFERWIWIQFPWLALAHGTAISWTVGKQHENKPPPDEVSLDPSTASRPRHLADGYEGDLGVPLDTSAAIKALDAAKRATATLLSGGQKGRRYWTVKRRDPTKAPIAAISQERLRSRALGAKEPLEQKGFEALERVASGVNLVPVGAPLRLGAVNEAPLAIEASTDDTSVATAASSADASALADTVALVPAMPTPGGTLADVAGAVDANERHNVRLARVAARLPPRRMRVGPTMGGGYGTSLEGGCGPFSSSSLKAQRKGTRFPSAAVLIEEEHVRKSGLGDDEAKAAATRFGGVEEPKDLIGHMGLRELQRLDLHVSQNAKDLSHLDHTCQIFPASHYDVAKASANARVARLRSAHDHLISVRRDRKRALRAKMVRISDRIRADDYCLMQLNRGEQTLVTLDKRLESVRVALAESAALGAYYAEVARCATDARPVAGAARIEIVEKQLHLARVQSQDLLDKRRDLHERSEDATRVAKPKLKREELKWQAMRSVAQERARLVAAQVKALGAKVSPDAMQPTYRRYSTQKNAPTPTKAAMLAQLGASKTHAVAEKDEVDTEPKERLLRLLKLAAGATDPREVARKLKRSQELSQTLHESHKAHVLKSTQLKGEVEKLQGTMAALRLGSPDDEAAADAAEGEGGEPNTHEMDAALFTADLHLGHARRHYSEVRAFLATVAAGLTHVGRLLEAYTARAKDGDGVERLELDPDLVVEVERGDIPPAESDERAPLVRLLGLCEDTIVSVKEALAINRQVAGDDEGPARPPSPPRGPAGSPGKRIDRIRASLTPAGSPLKLSAHCDAARPVRVVTAKAREKDIQREVRRRERRDRELAIAEAAPPEVVHEKGAAAFVREGTETGAVAEALRQANKLSRLKQGPRAPLGLAVSQALIASEAAEKGASSLALSKPHQLGLSNPNLKITTRDGIKKAGEKAEREQRKQAALKAAEDA